jgi:hypothetical protein
MDLKKIIDLLGELHESSFVEGESEEELYIQYLIQGFLSQTRNQYYFIESCLDKTPTFSDFEIMALKQLANMAIAQTEDAKETPLIPAKKSAIKGKRGSPNKETSAVKPTPKTVVSQNDDDEYIDSEFPLRDPKTGKQQIDPETGKPMYLRIKKNANQVKPPGYIPINNAELSRITASKAQIEAAANSAGFEKKMTKMVESSTMTSNADQGLAAALRHALK